MILGTISARMRPKCNSHKKKEVFMSGFKKTSFKIFTIFTIILFYSNWLLLNRIIYIIFSTFFIQYSVLNISTKKDNKDNVFVFNGWMFSSSPSIAPFDHPVYDVWLVNCY